jgi:hypothetical protein
MSGLDARAGGTDHLGKLVTGLRQRRLGVEWLARLGLNHARSNCKDN